MNSRNVRNGCIALALAVGLSLTASTAAWGQAGSQGFADTGAPTANTGNINTSTSFTIGDLVSNGSQSGLFVGMGSQTFGTVAFDTTVGTSLSFGNAVFGSFASTSITLASDVPGAVAYYALGEWTPGTYGSVAGGPFLASFTISYTQTPAGTGAISDSSTFSVPPAPLGVPEPSSFVLLGLGAIGFVGYRRLRRARA